MPSPRRARTSRSTSASVVPGRIRQSSSTLARPGITLRLLDPVSIVGAIVIPATAGTRCSSAGCMAAAVARAER
jgi:hypothetical protein